MRASSVVLYREPESRALAGYLVTTMRLIDLAPTDTFAEPDVLGLAEDFTRLLANKIASASQGAGQDRRNRVVVL